MDGVTYPTRDDVVIVRRGGERQEMADIQRWDVHTIGGELLGQNFLTRDAAEAAARPIAQERGVTVFYEHDPRRPDSTLQVIAVFGRGRGEL